MKFPTMWYVRPAKVQSDQNLCLALEYSMSVKLLIEQGAAQARLSLHLSKCHIVGNHISTHF